MINIIVAIDKNYGIGKDSKLPWYIKDDLKIFKEKTLNTVCIAGRKTYDELPILNGRMVIPVSISNNEDYMTFNQALKEAQSFNKPIFIIGGSQIYSYVLKNNEKKNIKIHISFIKNTYDCDTFFDKELLKDFYISSLCKHDEFDHCEMVYKQFGEYQYLNLINDVLINGERRVGRNGEVISDFCKHLKFDLRDGFPLLTTKKMFLKGIIEELLFFIRGDTNSKILEEKGINIWKGNTSREFLDQNGFSDRKEGEMGPMYGSIWRNFNGLPFSDEKDYSSLKSIEFGIDQLKNVINEIKTNPNSRRILLTTYNPGQVKQGVLYPCHSVMIQFYVQNGFLDMFCYNRSSDLFLGVPFNLASSSLLLIIIAKLTNLIPRYLNLSLGDVHIYSEHEEQVKEQLTRYPYIWPNIILPEFRTLEEVEKLTYEDFKLKNYYYYPSIKASMVA